MKKLLLWWLAPKFPEKQMANGLAFRPNGFVNKLRNFYRTWLVHPLKRRIAKYYLIFLKVVFGLKVIGITGSAGKTTTKEMLASILKQAGETVYSYANIDPIFNIPTTILKCGVKTKYLILEMGVEYPGEMNFYLWLAKLDIGVITNISATHVEFLGNIEGVVKEKSKLVTTLSKDKVAVLNSRDLRLRKIAKKVKCKIIWFGDENNIFASRIRQTPGLKTEFDLNVGKRKISVQIPFLGNHFVQNALAASATALALGFEILKIKEGLEKVEKPEHRMNVIKSKNGYLVIDDTYNANPLAVKETIETLNEIKSRGRKIFVFGEMKELGNLAAKSHAEVGDLISKSDIDIVFTIGELTKYVGGISEHFDSQDKLITRLRDILRKGDVVLIKGSRSMKMEDVVKSVV